MTLRSRRILLAGLAAVLATSVVVAARSLPGVLDDLRSAAPGWIAVAVALELGSCLGFVIVFRLVFDRIPAPEARRLAWISMASGVLLPGGSVSGFAVNGWLMCAAGSPARWVARRTGALFLLTSAFSVAAVIVAGLTLWASGDFLLGGAPALAGLALMAGVGALPAAVPTSSRRGRELVAAVVDARRAFRRPSARLLGAVGQLVFDIAVLWATLRALGETPPVDSLVLAYTLGYLANLVPVPGGIGALETGIGGALVLYGISPVPAAAAVLIYHAIAFWVPAAGGAAMYLRARPLPTTRPTPAPAPA